MQPMAILRQLAIICLLLAGEPLIAGALRRVSRSPLRALALIVV